MKLSADSDKSAPRLPRSLAWRLPAAFAVLALVMFALVVASWQSSGALRDALDQRDAADRVLAELATLEASFLPRAGRALCAATGTRVSAERDLGSPAWPEPLARLRSQMGGRAEAQAQLDELEADLRRWELRHEQPLREACRNNSPLGTAAVLAIASQGAALRDALMLRVQALHAQELARQQQRELALAAEATTSRNRFTLMAVAAVLLALAGVIAVQAGTRRLLEANRRLQQLDLEGRRQRMVLAHLPDAVIAFDTTGRVLWANPAAEQMFGWPVAERAGTPIWDLVPALEKELAWPDTQPDPGAESHTPPWRARRERMLACRAGHAEQTFPIELALVQTRLEGERLGVAIARDLGEAERMDRIKHEFVSVVSHELRTPLTSIHGSLSMLADGMAGALEPPAARLVSLAHRNSERLVTLVNDILDYEKLAAGQMHIEIAPLDLAAAAQMAVESIEGYALRHQVVLRVAAPDEPPWVDADASRLQQVLANLLSNAVKFSPVGGMVQVNVSRRHGEGLVWVIDTGPGVPESFRERLFQPFAQADGTNTRRQGGTGLGLAVSLALMQQMHGRIGLAPGQPGQGAVFWIALPLMGAAAAAVSDFAELS